MNEAINLSADQERAALLVASGELDQILDRIQQNVDQVRGNKATFLRAAGEMDSEEAKDALREIAIGLNRIREYAGDLGL